MLFDDEETHLSQLASDFLNPAAPRPLALDEPTDFRAAFGSATVAGEGSQQQVEDQPAEEQQQYQPQLPPLRHGKIINDPVHGNYRLDPVTVDIIDSRHFQRLRRLKQLGMAYYVFPGASHNRFEHSLGVAHLAYSLGLQLLNLQRDELDIDRRDLRVVELTGACHDLGHGPFSHVFDREFLRQKGITNWEHEEMSANLFDAIIDEKHLDSLREDDIKRVKAFITAGHDADQAGATFGGKRWLAEIVANGRNSVDVDKWDYLMRDSMYCGVKVSCDINRLRNFSKVIGDEICYKYSEYMNLHELFHSRASMHRQVYTHRKAKAIEFMMVDALLEADPVLRLTDKIWDVNQFVQLDDGVLELVENCTGGLLGPLLHVEPEQERALAAAQAIIARLRRRDLYKYCSEALVPEEQGASDHWKLPTAQDIVNSYQGNSVQLRPEDVILHEVKINHAHPKDGRKNPLDHVSFFDDFSSTTSRKLKPEQISGMMPPCFQEKTVRVYSRNSSPAYVAAVHQAFEVWARTRFGPKFVGSTPLKVRPPGGLPPVPAAMAAAAAAAFGDGTALIGAGTGKRGRELFHSAAGDDTSPTNLLRTKQRRRVERSLSDE
ncbi:hypothetical protein N2152v2_002236 [Parachlorella kessleri]